MNIPEEFKKPPQTLGDWVINVLISKLPLIGFIMLIVWAVDKDTAELIMKLIGFAIAVIIISIIGFSFFTHFADEVDWSQID